MLSEPTPSCPLCNHFEKSYKVSFLYLEGSAWLNHQNTDHNSELNSVMKEYLQEKANKVAQDQFVSRLVGLLSPPSGEKQFIRQIHPDGMVGLFFVISIIMVVKAFNSQPNTISLIIILLAAGLSAYIIFRKLLVSRYNQRKLYGQQEIERIEKAVSRWMRAYYCSRDQCVFDPVSGSYASLDQLNGFFRQE